MVGEAAPRDLQPTTCHPLTFNEDSMAESNTGKVVQVIGPVIDVEFAPEHLPEL